MLNKSVHLVLEGAALQIEYSSDSELITFRLNDFEKDEEKSKPGHEVFKERDKCEVYLEPFELKEIVKALATLIPEEEIV